MATMINKNVLLVISSKFDHAESIFNHYFGIYGKTKRKFIGQLSVPDPTPATFPF